MAKLEPAPPRTGLEDRETRDAVIVHEYKRGETVFLAGERPQSLYYILSGIVKMLATSTSGRSLITELYFEGERFSAIAALHGDVYSCSAVCLTDCRLQLTSLDNFRRAFEGDPRLARRIVEMYQEKSHFQRRMMVELAVGKGEQRAALALLMLAGRLASASDGRAVMPNFLTRQDFAELIGTTSETAIRIMSRFRKKGIVSESPEQVTVDLAALRAISGDD
ncbi:MAG: Crp/Fnr family transcriptional regulator [Armatimonadetes bacterium]|nr:Crp/Fnr family transcriptional regulator [Armatimonadota bacterium]